MGRQREAWPADFTRHFAARLSSVFGSQCTYIAFPLLALDLFSPAWAALVTACSYGSSLLLGFPAGVLADRMSRRRIMVVAELVQLLAMIALCLTLWLDAATLALLCVVSFVNGGMHAVFGAASTSSIPDLVPRKLLASALSANEARNAALSIIGPIAGSGLLVFHPAAPFLVAAGTFALSVVLLSRLRDQLRPQDGLATSPVRVRDGLSSLVTHPLLRRVVTAQMLLSLVLTGAFFTVLALLSAQGQQVGAGLVTALTGVALLGGSALAPRVGPRTAPLAAIRIQAALWAAALALVALSPGLASAAVALVLMWVMAPSVRVSIESWIADHIPSGERGRLQATRGVANAVASPLGPVLCGVLVAGYGFPTTLGLLATIAAAAGLATISGPDLRRSADHPA